MTSHQYTPTNTINPITGKRIGRPLKHTHSEVKAETQLENISINSLISDISKYQRELLDIEQRTQKIASSSKMLAFTLNDLVSNLYRFQQSMGGEYQRK